ncbi:uncharacterized protein LOC110601241 isoform X1 [Manihot esculenta]|uniref:uncharacterized protein LOC110601241 isoform X1 n=1 Tax=Manihot esculenta TaxID=3983 RepID=UPI000B5D59E7|nr:uncharacterized protein LOC110601241 isoform X1 [Manihot esculenta]
MDGHDAKDPKQSTADMTAFVQNLLQQMVSLWLDMSEDLYLLNHTSVMEMANQVPDNVGFHHYKEYPALLHVLIADYLAKENEISFAIRILKLLIRWIEGRGVTRECILKSI